MRNTSPKKCLLFNMSDSISTDEKANAGIILSESEITHLTEIVFFS